MSALHAFGITNLLVKTDDEVPALDGSALEFCKQLGEAGVPDQAASVEPIRIKTKFSSVRRARAASLFASSPPTI